MADQSPQNIIVIKTGTVIGSKYANIVSVAISDNEITLEFAYKHPRPEIKEAQVVSRVTMPKQTAIDLSHLIYETNRHHEERKKGKHE